MYGCRFQKKLNTQKKATKLTWQTKKEVELEFSVWWAGQRGLGWLFSAFQCCLCAVFFHPLLWNIFSPGLAKRGRGDVMSSLPLCTARSDFDGVAVPSAQREKRPAATIPIEHTSFVLGFGFTPCESRTEIELQLHRSLFVCYIFTKYPPIPALLLPAAEAWVACMHTHTMTCKHTNTLIVYAGDLFSVPRLSVSRWFCPSSSWVHAQARSGPGLRSNSIVCMYVIGKRYKISTSMSSILPIVCTYLQQSSEVVGEAVSESVFFSLLSHGKSLT